MCCETKRTINRAQIDHATINMGPYTKLHQKYPVGAVKV